METGWPNLVEKREITGLFGLAKSAGRLACVLSCVVAHLMASTQAMAQSADDETFVQAQVEIAGGNASKEQNLEAKRAQRSQELRYNEGAIALSKETLNALSSEVEIIQSDRKSLNAELLSSATRAQKLETALLSIEDQLESLGAREDIIRTSLVERRVLLAQVLAALQRMGRNPPPALLIGPSDALQSVRSAILMGAVVPEMRDEANALLADLEELRDLKRTQGTQKELFVANLEEIKAEEQRMQLLIEEKRDLENLVA